MNKNFTLLLLLLFTSTEIMSKVDKPNLIVVISIDQFRADYLKKFSHLFLPATSGKKIGGFRYLTERGAYFSHGEYGLLQNMTAPGHATILTGSYTYQSGIPNNDWYDNSTQKYMYCTEDQSQKTVGATPSSPHVGTSPKNLIGTTLGDELKNAYSASKVVSLALKDRAAILMGGKRADLALWFDAESFKWVSSEYYLSSKELPQWVNRINRGIQEKIGKELNWEKKIKEPTHPNTLVKESKYSKEMGLTFPHKTKLGSAASLLFPIGIELPYELAKSAIEEYKLGQDAVTDILAIGLSNHDYVGHHYGPESDEIREITILEDQIISNLLNHLNQKIPGGLQKVWVVLTADHGVTGNPQELEKLKIASGLINESLINQEMEKYLEKKYGKSSVPWMLAPSELNFYINKKVIQEKELDLYKVRDEVAKYVRDKAELLVGIADLFSGTDVRRRTLPQGMHEKNILRTYYEGRSGDIILIPLPNYVVEYGTTTHLSGYSCDRYVPMIFAGRPFKPGLYAGGEVVDIAPTLAFLLGIIPPSCSEGKILEQSLNLR